MRTNRTDLSVLRRGLGPPRPARRHRPGRRVRGALPRLPAGVALAGRGRVPPLRRDDRLLWLDSRSKWHCYSCRYQFSVTAGTLFHSSHLPVWKWFVSVHLMLESPEGISANELRRMIGGSYKTAWFAAHRIRAAMRGRGAELLRSLVEAESGHLSGLTSPADPFWDDVAAAGSLDPQRDDRPDPDAPPRRRPPPPAEREVPPRLHRRAALAVDAPRQPARLPRHDPRPARGRRHLV